MDFLLEPVLWYVYVYVYIYIYGGGEWPDTTSVMTI